MLAGTLVWLRYDLQPGSKSYHLRRVVGLGLHPPPQAAADGLASNGAAPAAPGELLLVDPPVPDTEPGSKPKAILFSSVSNRDPLSAPLWQTAGAAALDACWRALRRAGGQPSLQQVRRVGGQAMVWLALRTSLPSARTSHCLLPSRLWNRQPRRPGAGGQP